MTAQSNAVLIFPADASLYAGVNMGDDPKKKKADSKRQSQQPHEVAYRKRKAASKTKNRS
jgi:hypothetical protein